MNKSEEISKICDAIYFHRMNQNRNYPKSTLDIIEKTYGPNRIINKKFTLSGYKMALYDTATMVNHMSDGEREKFLRDFREHFGFNFFSLANDPKKVVRKVIKRGCIKNEGEFNVLKDCLGSVVDTELGATIARLLEEHELGG